MDAVSLIMRALEQGNTPDIGIEAIAPDDWRNLYDEFLGKMSAVFLAAGEPTLLENYMAQPELYDSTVAEVLEESGAIEDDELISAAQSVMDTMDPRRAARGAYSIDMDDGLDDDEFDEEDENLDAALDAEFPEERGMEGRYGPDE